MYSLLVYDPLMDSSASTLLFASSPLEIKHQNGNGDSYSYPFNFKGRSNIPLEFIWPERDLVDVNEELREPLVDLDGFYKGNDIETQHAAKLIRAACLSHGFFQVFNHGVDSRLISLAHDHMDAFFKLSITEKVRAQRKSGSLWGYSGCHADRFSSKLPWKETLSFGFDENSSESVVEDFFESTLGKDFEETGMIHQKYCEAMKKLSLVIMELLAISLGVERSHYKKFFEDSCSIMRCNYYPPCKQPNLALGTGPHCDPTSLTILHQDQVGGLEVFVKDKWQSVRPRQDALVINIGDTFSALSNGMYKSCLHRAVVNKDKERRSLAFFVCPREDKVVRPPKDLICIQRPRKYPDFTWSELLEYTQKHYRANETTLQNFTTWLLSSKPSRNKF